MLTFFGVTKNKNVNLTEGDNATVLAEKLLCIFKWVDFQIMTQTLNSMPPLFKKT